MERKPLIPYSRLVGDDGAFATAKADLSEFLKFIESEGAKLQGVLSGIDIKDTKGIAKVAKDVENLRKMRIGYDKALKAVNKTEALYQKALKEGRKLELDRIKNLERVKIKIQEYRSELAKLLRLERERNKESAQNITSINQLKKAIEQLSENYARNRQEVEAGRRRVSEMEKENTKLNKQNLKNAETINKLRQRIKDLNEEYKKQKKEAAERAKANTKETKLQQAINTVENKRVSTLTEVRERMAALRLVVQNTNLTTEDGRKKIEAYNKEIDELTKVLSDNSDQFIKNKINVGNYKESIKEALDEIGIFKTQIPLLDAVMNKLIETLLASKDATEANTAATQGNTASLGIVAKAQTFLAKIFRKNVASVGVNTAAVEANTVAVGVETAAVEANTVATITNTTVTNQNTAATVRNTAAVAKTSKSLRALNTALKTTGIILLIAALASLFAVFRQGRAGVVASEKAMARFGVIAKVTITTLAEFGKGLFSFFGTIGSSISNSFNRIEKAWLNLQLLMAKSKFWKDNEDEVASLESQINSLDKTIQQNSAKNSKAYDEAFSQMGTAISKFKGRIDDGTAAIKTLDEAIYRAFEIGDTIKKAELNILRLQKAVRGLEIMADDDTLSLNTQLQANALLLENRINLLKEEAGIQKLNLELANAKARADLQANATTIGARANSIAAIKDETKFTEALLQLNIDLDERKGENPLDDESLTASVDALKNYKAALNEVDIARQENAVKARQIQRDIFEQNLDLLIDLIDKEKSLSEQQVNDTVLNYERRYEEFLRFQEKFKDNAQKELFEFNKLAVQSAVLLQKQLQEQNLPKAQADLIRGELKKLEKMNLEFKFFDDGTFEIFNGDVKLSIQNIVELNKQLQSAGLAEIPVNRLREVVIETQNWVRDTKEQKKAIESVGIALNQLTKENYLSAAQLKQLRAVNAELAEMQDPDNLPPGAYDKAIKKIEELEKRKTKILEDAETQRLHIRLQTLDKEQAQAEADLLKKLQLQDKEKYGILAYREELTEGDKALSEDLMNITKERLDIQNQLEEKAFEKNAERDKERLEKLKEKWEQFKEDIFNVLTQIADKFVEMANKQVEIAEDRVSKQEKVEDDQRARAESGLENTLAFEQEQTAKREAEAEKARKKAERLEKVKSLWTSYTNYASDPNNKDGMALTKTLRDFAILEAIQASFGDGGLVADKIPTNGHGLTRGRSHQGNNGGIPVMVEGGEGFFSRRAVDNFGEENFRVFHDMLNRGKFNPNMFKEQKDGFVQMMPISVDNSKIERGLQEVKDEIRNKPVPFMDVKGLVSGFVKITEGYRTKNKTVRNSYLIKKKRF